MPSERDRAYFSVIAPDPSWDFVRILAAGADPSIIDWAIYDLLTDPEWAELLADPQSPIT